MTKDQKSSLLWWAVCSIVWIIIVAYCGLNKDLECTWKDGIHRVG